MDLKDVACDARNWIGLADLWAVINLSQLKVNQLERLHGACGQTLSCHRMGPEFASRSLHVGFVVNETEVWVGFPRGFSLFPCHKLHFTISPHFSHSFRFISFHSPLWQCVRRGRPAFLHNYSHTFNKEATLYLIPRPRPVLDKS